ncbi:MAG: hypothetical protein KDD33_08795 [Bdellovibrionales bacterium]|nr:hypothetical protein [Bdellovibrionales bacterium]
MKILSLLSIVLFALSSTTAFAAPVPGTSSSALTKPKLGIYKSKFGFEIMAKNSDWIQTQPPKKTKFVETVFRSPEVKNNTRATLTVRVDRLKKKTSLKKYVKRWVKEYPKYGYDVLGSKKFNSGGKQGYVVDLVNNKKKRQLRQVIYFKKDTAVLMTCRDHSASFKGSLRECNSIIKNFRWN